MSVGIWNNSYSHKNMTCLGVHSDKPLFIFFFHTGVEVNKEVYFQRASLQRQTDFFPEEIWEPSMHIQFKGLQRQQFSLVNTSKGTHPNVDLTRPSLTVAAQSKQLELLGYSAQEVYNFFNLSQKDNSGKLDFKEFRNLYKLVVSWRVSFLNFRFTNPIHSISDTNFCMVQLYSLTNEKNHLNQKANTRYDRGVSWYLMCQPNRSKVALFPAGLRVARTSSLHVVVNKVH